MYWLYNLFFGDTLAHTIFVLALVITVGILLGKIKIGGVSLGTTWILFVGIAASHFGMTIDPGVLSFIKEFGLILFVFSIGLQVGPGFFSSFKNGGMQLVGLASLIVVLGVATAYALHLATDTPIPTMVGILSGAVTNTPGLGAAQQAYSDASGINDPSIALGYAVAYPLGVIGIIFSMIFIRYALRIRFEKEDEALAAMSNEHKKYAEKISVQFTNAVLDGRTVGEMKELINRSFVISRIADADNHITVATQDSRLHIGDQAADRLLVGGYRRHHRLSGSHHRHALRRVGIARQPARIAAHPHHQTFDQRQEIRRPGTCAPNTASTSPASTAPAWI